MSTNELVVIGPTDPALNLQGNWTKLSLQDPQGNDQTIVIASSSASGGLNFTGSQIAVYGIIPVGESVESLYSVDGASPGTYVSPGDATSPQWGTIFYLSPPLSTDAHELTFSVTNATTQEIFALQFILYQGTGVQGASTTQTSLPTSTGGAEATGSVAADGKSQSQSNEGAIVGGVVGGVAGFVVIGLLIFFGLRRGNKRAYYYTESGDLLHDELKAVPFTQPPPVPDGDVLHTVKPQMAGYNVSAEGTQVYQPVPQSEVGESVHSSAAGSSRPTLSVVGGPPVVRPSPNMPRSKAAEAGLLSVENQPMYHADSGTRFDANGRPVASGSGSASTPHEPQIPTDVPPSYSES